MNDLMDPLSPLLDPMATPIQKAVYYCGGARKVAGALSVSSQTVYNWCWSDRIAAEFVLPLEKLCNGYITRHALRPDLYPFVQPYFGEK
jgi:DNA-binding transcriptional regulator YdaS (Cro superfamily)